MLRQMPHRTLQVRSAAALMNMEQRARGILISKPILLIIHVGARQFR